MVSWVLGEIIELELSKFEVGILFLVKSFLFWL